MLNPLFSSNSSNEFSRLSLYLRPTCPFCVRVTDYCQSAGIDLETRDIGISEHLEALLAGGGKRQVPCLRIEDERGNSVWLYESLDIIDYFKRNLAG